MGREGSQVRKTGEKTGGADSRVLAEVGAGTWILGSEGRGHLGTSTPGSWEKRELHLPGLCTQCDAAPKYWQAPPAALPAHILQVVVEVHSTSTQVSPQECGVGSEDRGHRQPPGTAEAEPDTRQPFMEVCDHVRLLLALGQELWGNREQGCAVSPCVL